MNILITGAAGYIGGRLVAHLCEQDWVYRVVGTDVNEPRQSHPKYVFDRRDIRESMDDIFDREKIDAVVHAAYILPPIHNKRLMEDINKGGTKNILSAVSRAGVRHILYTSSATAYGFYPDNDVPLTEESPLRGNDDFIYTKNKKEIEKIFQTFVSQHPDITVTILRPCFVVGPGFANPLAKQLKKKLVILPANARSFQFVHEDDVIEIMALMLKKRINGVYNVGGEGTLTFAEMIRMLGNFRLPAMRLLTMPWIASSDKLIRETGYRFKYDTRQAFEDFVRSVNKEK